MTRPHISRMLLPAVVLLCAVLSACGAPSTAEGTADGRDFMLGNAHAEVREHGDRSRSIVLADTMQPTEEGAAEELWLVILHLPADLEVTVGEELKLGPKGSGLVSLQVSVGELETLDEDGKVVNAKSPIFVDALSGTVTLWKVEDVVAGEFEAVLEKGGYVQGVFEAPLQ